MTIFISSVIRMLMHGQANGTISVKLHHFGSFVCAVSPQQPNRCLTAVILTARRQQQSHKCKWFIVTQSGSFYMTFLYHFNDLFTGKQNKRLENMQGVCEQIRIVFFLLPYYYLGSFILNVMYDILLYKHVFENMYALCLYHAVCYLASFFSICLPPDMIFVPFLLPCIMLFTLVPIFYHPVPVFQSSTQIMIY